MKVGITTVAEGVDSYIQSEFVGRLQDWRKWVVAAGAGIVRDKAVALFHQLKGHPVVKSFGIVDEDDNIDIEVLYDNFRKAAETGPITPVVPVIGPVKFTAEDVDKLYSAIKAAHAV